MFSSVYFELFAFCISLIGVLLTAKSFSTGWIFGIAGSACYVPVFFLSKLYAETGLQLFYIAMGAFGFYSWIRKRSNQGSAKVSNVPTTQILILILFFLVGSFVLAKILLEYSNTDVPYFDACMGISGLLITWMMAKKYIEHWICWVIVDCANAGLFIFKSLHLTAILYLIMAAIAIYGMKSWRKELVKS